MSAKRGKRLAIWGSGSLAWLVRCGSSRGACLALIALTALVDHAVHWGQFTFVPRALADEPLHVATAVVVLGAITRWRGRPPWPAFSWAMLAAAVLIDLDHLPREFNVTAWTAGTPRPYSHALWVVALLAAAAVVACRLARAPGRRRAATAAVVAAGAALGTVTHFLRDAATAPIPLWWPATNSGLRVPYLAYLVVLLALTALPRRRASAIKREPKGLPSAPEASAEDTAGTRKTPLCL